MREIQEQTYFLPIKVYFLIQQIAYQEARLQLDSSYYQDHLWKSKNSNILTQPRSMSGILSLLSEEAIPTNLFGNTNEHK